MTHLTQSFVRNVQIVRNEGNIVVFYAIMMTHLHHMTHLTRATLPAQACESARSRVGQEVPLPINTTTYWFTQPCQYVQSNQKFLFICEGISDHERRTRKWAITVHHHGVAGTTAAEDESWCCWTKSNAKQPIVLGKCTVRPSSSRHLKSQLLELEWIRKQRQYNQTWY